MIGLVDAFSNSYAQARVKFLEAAATAGLQRESFNVSSVGKDGEVHALDIALQTVKKSAVVGDAQKSEKLLIINSANAHGNEFAGAGVQVHLLHNAEWLEKVQTAGVNVLYVHGFLYESGYSKPLFDVIRKYIDAASLVYWFDFVDSRKFKKDIHEYFVENNLDGKCWITDIQTVSTLDPVWQGQTISRARQALFNAVDELHKI